jgi:ABC-type multidrug transport system fused ATPase/permease subunit
MSCTYGLFSGIRGACFGVANQILVRRMRQKLFTTLLNQDIAFFDAEAVGALTSRLGSDCQQVSQIIGTDLNIMFRNALQGIGAFLYLMALSWQMALTTLAICSIMWYFMQIYGRYQKKTAKAAQDTVASANEVAEETLSQLRVVRTFGTEKEELNRSLSLAVSDPTPLVSDFQLSILVSHKVMIHGLHCFPEGLSTDT